MLLEYIVIMLSTYSNKQNLDVMHTKNYLKLIDLKYVPDRKVTQRLLSVPKDLTWEELIKF